MTEATEKQIKFAQTLHIESPEKYSKEVLRELIQNKLDETEKVETIRPGEPEKTQPEPSKREYHLSPEQVNTNALNCAISVHVNAKTVFTPEQIIEMAKIFKEFIENGN